MKEAFYIQAVTPRLSFRNNKLLSLVTELKKKNYVAFPFRHPPEFNTLVNYTHCDNIHQRPRTGNS